MDSQRGTVRIDPILIGEAGHTECLLGNEAIVRGALESGVAFACGYPGTPSSEITDTFARIYESRGIVFEYSVNEKVAVEMAFAASLAGARSICAMKHLGLMVAGDPISTIPYIGVEAGMVVVSAGDPGCGTSPNELDHRLLGPLLRVPVLDPSTPQEALDMTRFAFELSEGSRLPVILRATTHVCHTRGVVEYGSLVKPSVKGFRRDPRRYVPIPSNARRMRLDLEERLGRAREIVSSSGFFRCDGSGPVVVLAAGSPAAACSDILEEQGLAGKVSLWRLGALYPLPEGELVERLRGVERLLVVEELMPFLEDRIQLLCARHGLAVEILGKRTGHLPETFDYSPAVIRGALYEGLRLGDPPGGDRGPGVEVPPRPPTLCAGCPHRAAFFAARAAFDDDQLYFNDIGCYTLGYGPPLETADALLCMGAGITLAAGVSRVTGKRTVGFVGDSTFFHAGMPALLNAIKEDANMVVVILDNRVTAMTGFQESAGHEPGHEASIEGVARSMGARHVATVDPFDTAAAVAAFWKAGAETGVSVLILDRGCPVHEAREGRSTGGVTYGVDHSLCRKCGREEHELRCSQETTRGYERRLSVGRIMRTGSPGPVVAPCSLMCPLSLCIEGYVGHIAAGEYEEAMGHILARTPLPETVCRTCHAPCEDACVRANSGGSIAINALKRFVVEWAAGREELARPPAHEERNGMEVAVVGAGPSGLSAAHELAVRGYGVTMFDAEDEPGGLLSHGIPRYRLPRGALRRDINRVLGLGVRFEGGTRLGRELSLDDLLGGGYDAVYLAIGAGRALEIDMPGLKEEGSPVVVTALEYLGKVARGMEVEGGKSVVVVGGGNAAIDAARTALRLGVERVSVACIEDLEDMPAIRNEVLSAGREGVELYPGLRPLRVRTGGITFGPAGGNGVETDLDADLVIVAIGQVPDTVGIDGEIALERNRDGSIRVDPVTCRTSHPRIFAGGDLVGGEQTVTGAMAMGLRAAWGIDATLRDEAIAGLRPPPRLQVPVEREALPLGARGWAVSGRLDPNELSPSSRVAGFDEVVGAFSQEEAVAEASRCLMCGLCGNCRACIELLGCPAIGEDAGGRVVVDPVLCTGCGVCAELCPNGAFHVVDHV